MGGRRCCRRLRLIRAARLRTRSPPPARRAIPARAARRAAGRDAGARPRRARSGSACSPSATCSSICRATAREARTVAQLVAGRDGDGRRRGALDHLAPVRRRGMRPLVEAVRRRRDRADEGDVLQPAVARAQVPAGHAADAPRQVRGAQPLPRRSPRADGGGRRAATGEVATYPATEGLSSTQILALVREHRGALRRRRRAAARAAARRRAAARPRRRRSHAAHFGDHEGGRRRLAFEELLLLQLALLRRRARRREARARRGAARRPATLTARWLADSLPFAPTDDQRARDGGGRRRPRRAAGRCSGC